MNKNILGYYDLNINVSCFQQENVSKLLQTLYNFGYRTIALNHLCNEDEIEPKKKRKKGHTPGDVEIIPTPFDLSYLDKEASKLQLKNFSFLNRLTIQFSNPEMLQRIEKLPNFKNFDILAVIPTNNAALMHVLNSFDADIIGYDPLSKAVKLNRKTYSKFVDKGYFFEISYSPAIEDSTKRKNIILLAHLYHTFGKSRNIIITSGAEDLNLIRGPYDIINLGLIFGLNTLQSKNSVLASPSQVILNARGRQQGKIVMLAENLGEVTNTTESTDTSIDGDQPVAKKIKAMN